MSKHYLYTFLNTTQQNDFGSAQNGRKMYTITNTWFITNDVMYLNQCFLILWLQNPFELQHTPRNPSQTKFIHIKINRIRHTFWNNTKQNWTEPNKINNLKLGIFLHVCGVRDHNICMFSCLQQSRHSE